MRFFLLFLVFVPVSCGGLAPLPKERHFTSLRQLTFGGENAEAYFSPDSRTLVFQSTRGSFRNTAPKGEWACDQILTIPVDGGRAELVSTATGRTTCGYYLPAGDILFSSTHAASPNCPPKPSYARGYVWPIYDTYDIYLRKANGALAPLIAAPGYDAEATVSPMGDRIVFTSTRDGDLEIYTAAIDGSDVRRLTTTPGYDGGAFFSPDGKRIVYRAHHPTGAALIEYRALLKAGLVRPSIMEIFVMDADGKNHRQLTRFGKASFAPFFHNNNRQIFFASNFHDPRGRNFDIYLMADDGSRLERITWSPDFDGFPMMSPDGKMLAFSSNRGGRIRGETNVFVAEWQD